jgi:hypothetical protein
MNIYWMELEDGCTIKATSQDEDVRAAMSGFDRASGFAALGTPTVHRIGNASTHVSTLLYLKVPYEPWVPTSTASSNG